MKKTNIIIVVALLVVVAIAFLAKQDKKDLPVTDSGQEKQIAGNINSDLPTLIDLGAGKCIPCKMMAPILEELKVECKDSFNVNFIDVWENPGEKEKYGINLIPTQIFIDASGKEIFRHEGFFSKEDILGKWKEFGVDAEKGDKNEN